MFYTFFGHRDAPDSLSNILKSTLEDLIIKNDVSVFYVGNNGKFDKMVQRILYELSAYHNITYVIVLSSFNESIEKEYFSHTLLPEGLEKIPPRFGICWRNEWMINHSDVVITYVTHPSSGAAKYKQIAEKKTQNRNFSCLNLFPCLLTIFML